MADGDDNGYRPATITLAGELLTVYRGVALIDGPWVHLKEVRKGASHNLALGLDAGWEPHPDLTLNPSQVLKIEWTADDPVPRKAAPAE